MSDDARSVAERFAQISLELLSQPEEQPTLERIVALAVETIPGCDHAGISLRRGRGRRVETSAATDPLVDAVDALQYELDEGPCLDAIWVDDTYLIDDVGSDPRWPHWGPKASALGLTSVLSVRLATTTDTLGGLNLYSAAAGAFDSDALDTAHVYAAHAAAALSAAQEVTSLESALQTRHTIGVAQGLLMARYGVSLDQSFHVLRRLSQERNVKLREIAADLVAGKVNPGNQ